MMRKGRLLAVRVVLPSLTHLQFPPVLVAALRSLTGYVGFDLISPFNCVCLL